MSNGTCCHAGKNLFSLLGRIIIGALFLISGLMMVKYWPSMVEVITNKGLPYPILFLGIATALEILGGIFVILGYRTRLGAWFLIIFLAAATYLFHNFWEVDATHADAVREEFIRNIVYLGALLLLAAFGPGGYSIDAARCCRDETCAPKK